MKKLLLFALMFSLFPNVQAQKGDCFSSVSFLGGPALIHVMGGDSWKPGVGFMLGAETNAMMFSEESYLSVGLNFTLQGANYEEDYSTDFSMSVLKSAADEGMTFSGNVKLGYLNLPVVFVYRSSGGLTFGGGLQPGILVLAKDNYEGESMDYKDYVKGFEVGALARVGYAINDQISVRGQVVYGLTNINKESDDMYYSSSDKDHNLFVGVILGWMLPIK